MNVKSNSLDDADPDFERYLDDTTAYDVFQVGYNPDLPVDSSDDYSAISDNSSLNMNAQIELYVDITVFGGIKEFRLVFQADTYNASDHDITISNAFDEEQTSKHSFSNLIEETKFGSLLDFTLLGLDLSSGFFFSVDMTNDMEFQGEFEHTFKAKQSNRIVFGITKVNGEWSNFYKTTEPNMVIEENVPSISSSNQDNMSNFMLQYTIAIIPSFEFKLFGSSLALLGIEMSYQQTLIASSMCSTTSMDTKSLVSFTLHTQILDYTHDFPLGTTHESEQEIGDSQLLPLSVIDSTNAIGCVGPDSIADNQDFPRIPPNLVDPEEIHLQINIDYTCLSGRSFEEVSGTIQLGNKKTSYSYYEYPYHKNKNDNYRLVAWKELITVDSDDVFTISIHNDEWWHEDDQSFHIGPVSDMLSELINNVYTCQFQWYDQNNDGHHLLDISITFLARSIDLGIPYPEWYTSDQYSTYLDNWYHTSMPRWSDSLTVYPFLEPVYQYTPFVNEDEMVYTFFPDVNNFQIFQDMEVTFPLWMSTRYSSVDNPEMMVDSDGNYHDAIVFYNDTFDYRAIREYFHSSPNDFSEYSSMIRMNMECYGSSSSNAYSLYYMWESNKYYYELDYSVYPNVPLIWDIDSHSNNQDEFPFAWGSSIFSASFNPSQPEMCLQKDHIGFKFYSDSLFNSYTLKGDIELDDSYFLQSNDGSMIWETQDGDSYCKLFSHVQNPRLWVRAELSSGNTNPFNGIDWFSFVPTAQLFIDGGNVSMSTNIGDEDSPFSSLVSLAFDPHSMISLLDGTEWTENVSFLFRYTIEDIDREAGVPIPSSSIEKLFTSTPSVSTDGNSDANTIPLTSVFHSDHTVLIPYSFVEVDQETRDAHADNKLTHILLKLTRNDIEDTSQDSFGVTSSSASIVPLWLKTNIAGSLFIKDRFPTIIPIVVTLRGT
ncbi:hypothetical protein ADUPG1_012815 [Aduncisulcus paluster]|uniref:Uncharacterized protein n=1 Tax=Aduncisulcus paluster TaxID=2918883 RepID=A0ABQ5K5K1_9EUKA|nr:hypothetical protein ADUPG1_012815 [Aduncisulcus paluster]